MPDFPIVDSHVHIYDPGRLPYHWVRGKPVLERRYLLPDLDALSGGVAIDRIVFVEVDVASPRQLDEARWVAEQAKGDGRLQGMVAAVELERGRAVEPDLDALKAIPLTRGARRLIQNQADPEFCVRPGFLEALRLLPRYDFSFDICILHHQMPNTLAMARACPEVRFVLDHIGKPGIRAGLFDPWRRHIRDLATLPNVWCKLSGVVTEADHAEWTREAIRPYLDHVIESFGFDRLMYGGDWPVSELATSYRRWVDTVDWAITGCSEEEKRKLYRDTAITFYRLP